MANVDLQPAVEAIKKGGVVAYPTEAVFGLGCDPTNFEAVKRILQLKCRAVERGLIVIASDWEQVKDWVKPIPSERLQHILSTWPGALTWVFPASERVPDWIKGRHKSIALRISEHPLARELCASAQTPIVSTSANIEGREPARTVDEVQRAFKQGIDVIVNAPVGTYTRPTPIRDAISDEIIRE